MDDRRTLTRYASPLPRPFDTPKKGGFYTLLRRGVGRARQRSPSLSDITDREILFFFSTPIHSDTTTHAHTHTHTYTYGIAMDYTDM